MDGKPVFNDGAAIDPEKTDAAGIPRGEGSGQDFKVAETHEDYMLPFWTRMGCTPESFKRRSTTDKHNQLNQALRSRHLHMIAIGEFSMHLLVEQILTFLKAARSALVSSLVLVPRFEEVGPPRLSWTMASSVS
jgi:hypothetical protein